MALERWLTRLGAMDPSQAVLEVWHANRTPILLSTSGVLVFLYIYFILTEKRDNAAASRQKQTGLRNGSAASDWSPDHAEKTSLSVGSDHPSVPRRIKGHARKAVANKAKDRPSLRPIQPLVFFSSLTGTAQKASQELARALQQSAPGLKILEPQVLDLAEVDYDEYFINPPKQSQARQEVAYFYLIIVPSYNIDTINDNFLEHLKETHNDFRIDTAPLSGLSGYSVFGLGDRGGWATEDEGFCFQAKQVDRLMAKLTGRKRAYPLGMGDSKRDLKERLGEWTVGVRDVLQALAKTGGLGEGVPGSGDAEESDEECSSAEEDEMDAIIDAAGAKSKHRKERDTGGDLEDVEDLGKVMKSEQGNGRPPIAIDFTTHGNSLKRPVQTVKEMVPKSSPTYAALTKQGYSIVGSHSGVKICRWTKSALRGRGSCYKFSFYGIRSHQCMETTPSLSCSNKCVFCWRHGTNPVGTTWRWVVDPPELIFEGVKAGHYQKIKMMRGVPGVRAERFAEAMRIRHCALSLVGEPIFYPHINEFLALLHKERISSFLVCNAQHPDQLAALKAVTQLYVSIDASNKEDLRKIDRPLNRDFWERFQRCLDILREKRFKQRTVFRLTLVKGFNVDEEVDGYADLVERGLPCFVEIKGVTYCGTSTSASAGLSMANVPFYEEVTDFVTALNRKLNERGLRYGIAAEHAHSCCVLIASERFRRNGKWHTKIDYDKFFQLLEERGPDGDWTPEEYADPEPTADWALFGNGGFNPQDERVDRKGRKIES